MPNQNQNLKLHQNKLNKLRNQLLLNNHHYQKDNQDIIHKLKEKDPLMPQSKLYQVLIQGAKTALQDFYHLRPQLKEEKVDLLQKRRKVMVKFQDIFKRWTKKKKRMPDKEHNHAKMQKHLLAQDEWAMMKKQQWLRN